jgi:GTP cyclohydrolase I
MQDIQNTPALVPIYIDRVGINNFKLPLVVSDKTNGRQHTVALVDLGVDLPAEFKGTHMSRFVEALENWNEELSYQTMKTLLLDIKNRLSARKAYARFRFTYFLRKHSPISKAGGLMGYECALTGEMPESMDGDMRPHMRLDVEVPVLTVCPCSKAISKEGAHSQRAMVRISVLQKGFAWIEEFIDIAENAASSPVYPLLKREDEKEVTEQSFANPCFVEDVVRNAAIRLAEHTQISWFRVEVESMESIHAHNAFSCIERSV